MPFVIETKGFHEEIAKLQSLPTNLSRVLAQKINGWLVKVQEKILEGLGSHDPLGSRSGNLAASVTLTPAEAKGGSIRGSVQSLAADQAAGSHGPNPYPYGFVQEFGGTRFFDIFPVEKKALAFDWNGKHIVTQAVLGRYPLEKRSWFYPPAIGMEPQIVNDLEAAIQKEIHG